MTCRSVPCAMSMRGRAALVLAIAAAALACASGSCVDVLGGGSVPVHSEALFASIMSDWVYKQEPCTK